jgi:hypothetical protein
LPKRHQGSVALRHTFEEAHRWLSMRRTNQFATIGGERFEALAYTAGKGPHQGEKVIRFLKKGSEFARAYACCWGHDRNCGGTRIGMFSAALDAEMLAGGS